jgi:cullin 3
MVQAFESFINKDSRVASCLAQFIDDMLRSGLKGLSEGDVDSRLDKVIVIFRYLQDKDVFESFYKQHLAKRLLSLRGGSFETERNMIAKLKVRASRELWLNSVLNDDCHAD